MHKERQSNWELMRIIAMLMIIAGHFIIQSHAEEILSGFDLYAAVFLGGGARIAVQLFLMLGVWFMVSSHFRADRLLKLGGQTAFYSLLVVIVLALLGEHLKARDIVSGVFPFTFTLWFATSYLVLIAVSPWLHKILEWDRIVLRNFLIVLFILVPVVCSIHNMMDTYLCTVIWFMYVYLCMGYYKKYLSDRHFDKFKCLVFGGGDICPDFRNYSVYSANARRFIPGKGVGAFAVKLYGRL